ncbi:phosphoketolase [Streptomyces cyaneofuscatus]
MGLLFKQFSFPGGVPSHVAPETPGSIHEGGELGYALSHAYGAAFDHPELLVACVVGDGRRDGAARRVLARQQVPRPGPRRGRPADPPPQRLQDRQPDGPGPHPRGGTGPAAARLRPRPAVRRRRLPGRRPPGPGRGHGHRPRPHRRPPAGGPRGRRHRTPPLAHDRAAHPQGLDRARRGRRAAGGEHLALPPGPALRRPRQPRASAAAGGTRRAPTGPPNSSTPTDAPPHRSSPVCPRGRPVSAPPRTPTGGCSCARCVVSHLADHAVRVDKPGTALHEPTKVLGGLLESVMAATADRRDFRVVGPTSTASNRLDALYLGHRQGLAGRDPRHGRTPRPRRPGDGGALQHLCQGWLEGYLLTGGTGSSPVTRRSPSFRRLDGQ